MRARKVLSKVKSRIKSSSQQMGIVIPARYSIDSPLKERTDSKTILVEGWLIPNGGKVKLRVQYQNNFIDVKYGLKRPDVAKAFPDDSNALNSGFQLELLHQEDGDLRLEVDFGNGYQLLHRINVRYSPEQLVSDYFNPDLSQNMAEHLNLIQNKNKYYFEPERDVSYQWREGDPRLLAFYLPQFHPVDENDHVWGKGFTEWTNVTGDTPRFVGHQQPILPRDTGFYDLRYEKTMKQQIDMAKRHGIYGFCFYYYWFSGRRILEKPIDSFLRNKDWDFNFTICWANENWTKRWDGRDSEVIVAQEYLPEDPLKFIKDVEDILLDPRYMRQDSKPILTVFRASELKEPARYAQIWRDYFKKNHGLELYLLSCMSFEDKDPREYGFDAGVDFAPQSAFFKNDAFSDNKYPYHDVSKKLLDINFSGSVADYRAISTNVRLNEYFSFPFHNCVTPAWDNDARKKSKGFVMHNNNPDLYRNWLSNVLNLKNNDHKSPLIFINAWNEWAEGAMLEPSAHFGHAVLNRTSEVLSQKTAKSEHQLPQYGIANKNKVNLAVVVHAYYPETWDKIDQHLNLIDQPYDLFVSINEKDRDFKDTLEKKYKNVRVFVVPNRGRDVLPFLYISERLRNAGYKYLLKLHTKKSLHRIDGSDWFDELLDGLLPSENAVENVIKKLESETTIVGPKGHFVSLAKDAHMGSNYEKLSMLLSDLGAEKQWHSDKVYDQGYFAGTMFWSSIDALTPLFDLFLMPEDFESERGQVDGTSAHAVERLISLLPIIKGQQIYEIDSSGKISVVLASSAIKKYTYAP